MSASMDLIRQYFSPMTGVNDWVDDKEVRPLMIAAKAGNVPLMAALIAEGADVDSVDVEGGSALAYAVSFSQVQSIDYLVSKGCDLENLRAGLCALKCRSSSSAQALSRCGYDWSSINRENELVIWALEHGGGPWVIDFLASSGISLDAACTQEGSWEGATPLTYAALCLLDPCRDENHSVCRLLAAGADVRQLDCLTSEDFMYPEVIRVVDSYRAKIDVLEQFDGVVASAERKVRSVSFGI